MTAIELGKPGEADGAKVGELLAQTNENLGVEVAHALGDSAYSSAEAQRQAAEAGVELATKMPSSPKGKFGPERFQVNVQGDQARCPAGHLSDKVARQGDALLHKWDADVCATCPFKADCTEARARTLRVRSDFHARRRREKWARSTKGRAVLRERVAVEHAIARMKNLGAGVSRYFGRAKTKVQWLWTAALVNLLALFRLGAFEEDHALAGAGA